MGPGHLGISGGGSGRAGEFLRATGHSCEFGARLLPVVYRSQPRATTAALRGPLLLGRGWHPGSGGAAAGNGELLASSHPCSSSLAAAREEEGVCARGCLPCVRSVLKNVFKRRLILIKR